ncbi:unnamed protein product [Didymodactylos carnosus]|uniref:Uncharacterized protein n=1 Tax=Didymodactylos carnosus TaxID=1234261 RepID=A0A815EVL4_9BILA|nr:unnamed protein product [Didymodactylos carnosus]CAF4155997.1 unnamed protein product [Didymodactylos carnosus]
MSILFLVRATGKENHNINIEISARQLHGKNRILVGQRANEIDPLEVFREHVKDANESLLAVGNYTECETIETLKKAAYVYRKKMHIDEDIFKECRIIGRARCGADRNDQHNHQECEIKCHHCNGSHVSTEYKCPVINQYRGELIYELRKRSDKLPVDVQLFIPSEYRNSDERNKVIYNKKAQQQKQRQDEQRYNRNDYNAWPSVNSNVTTLVPLSPSYQTLNETIKSLDNALNALKQNYLQEQQKIEQKYKEHLNGINQGWLIMQQQMQTQTQILSTRILYHFTETFSSLLHENNAVTREFCCFVRELCVHLKHIVLPSRAFCEEAFCRRACTSCYYIIKI